MNKTAILVIYADGTMDHVLKTSGELRRIGQQIITAADNVPLPARDNSEVADTAPVED